MADADLPKLLAIDDSELIHRLLRSRLASERLELHCAMSGRDGLRVARALKPDVVLLDVDLGDMDGFDVLVSLKSDPDTQDIAVIFVSAGTDTASKVRGLDLGAVDFITKPFDIVELKARLRSAMRVQHLIQMLAQRAQIDGLTGLWNRTYFDRRLNDEFSEAIRHGRPLSLVIVDIDNFKQLNDHYGHLFGDMVLERFAQILSGGRASDVASRYGGEEFGIILPNITATEAAEVAERFRVQLESLMWSDHPGLVVTASFGVCDMDRIGPPISVDRLFSAADSALYRAKQDGRNRVAVAEPAVSRV
jgi:two-component system cell cycle response regulator